jgi:hypothetical protein
MSRSFTTHTQGAVKVAGGGPDDGDDPQAGEVTPPIALPNDVYLGKLVSIELCRLEDVNNEVTNDVGMEGFTKWLEGIRKGVDVKLGS